MCSSAYLNITHDFISVWPLPLMLPNLASQRRRKRSIFPKPLLPSHRMPKCIPLHVCLPHFPFPTSLGYLSYPLHLRTTSIHISLCCYTGKPGETNIRRVISSWNRSRGAHERIQCWLDAEHLPAKPWCVTSLILHQRE